MLDAWSMWPPLCRSILSATSVSRRRLISSDHSPPARCPGQLFANLHFCAKLGVTRYIEEMPFVPPPWVLACPGLVNTLGCLSDCAQSE